MNISGFTVLKNGVSLGYPFIESILSLLPLCDEYVILEGYSDDDTYSWLERLQEKYPDKIRLFREEWPQGLPGGRAIGEAQTRALKKCRGRWAYLLQADEIMPQENIPYLRELCSPRRLMERVAGKRRFNSYAVDLLNVVDNFQRFYSGSHERWSIRLVRNRPLITSGDDGWSLCGVGCQLVGTARLPRPVLHIGYNFPVNIWRKRLNHARLYPDFPQFQEWIRDAEQQLRDYERGALPPLPTDNPLNLPAVLAPLIGQMEYRVREELLA